MPDSEKRRFLYAAFTVIVAYEHKRPLVTFRRIDSVLRNVPSGKARDTALFAGWNNLETTSYKVARISDSDSLTIFYNRASINLRFCFLIKNFFDKLDLAYP